MKLIYGSVCSGIEAASVAWKPLGWECAFVSEIEPFPNAVLKHHYEKVPNHGNILNYHEWPITRLDVLIGGTPCQSFSVAGLRKGMDDPRGNLALTFLGVIDRFAPTWAIWENVPGVLSDAENAFGCFLGGLAQLGYGFAYRVLDAQFFGVAQRRRRVFVVGHSGGLWQRAAAVLFERESMCGNPPPGREEGKRVAPTTEGRAGRSGDNDFNTSGGLVAGTLFASGAGMERPAGTASETSFLVMAHGQGGDTQLGATHEGMPPLKGQARHAVAHSLKADGFDASEDGTGRGTPLVVSPIQHSGKAAGSATQQDAESGLLVPTVSKSRGAHSSSSGHLDPSTETPLPTPGMAVRRLIPRECERLQGFPDDYTLIPFRNKPACDGPRYKALGNSMAVPVIHWLGKRIEIVHQIPST